MPAKEIPDLPGTRLPLTTVSGRLRTENFRRFEKGFDTPASRPLCDFVFAIPGAGVGLSLGVFHHANVTVFPIYATRSKEHSRAAFVRPRGTLFHPTAFNEFNFTINRVKYIMSQWYDYAEGKSREPNVVSLTRVQRQ